MPSITAVVVSYERPDLLARCLESLFAQEGVDFETVVVDNASADPGVRELAERFPNARWVFNAANIGFGAACNQGIRLSASEHVVTLNNDLELQPGFLASLAAAVAGDRIGMVASVLLRHDDPTRVDSAGIAVDRAGISWERFAGARAGGLADWGAGPPLLGPVGGAALYRRATLDDVGGFDEGLRLYHEDLDLAWRGRNAGWDCALAPAARALHHHSATAGRESPLKRYYLARNKLLVIAANYPTPALYVWLPVILAYDLLAAGWYVAFARGGATLASRLALARGRLAALRMLPEVIARRQARAVRAERSPAERFALLAPAEMPWRVRSRFVV